ncbi:hypothetical protein F5146DRAFT_999384 [Armillaria mellea]|nr:hypothetical protein F5146DRAFT_999384 [Armillaria mellea]
MTVDPSTSMPWSHASKISRVLIASFHKFSVDNDHCSTMTMPSSTLKSSSWNSSLKKSSHDPGNRKIRGRAAEPDSLDVSGSLWVLGRVCGAWRDTLHSSPASWARKLVVTQPCSKYALEILKTYLEHTGEHPLNLRLIFGHRNEDMNGFLSLLVQSRQRWKHLHIIVWKHHMLHLESIPQFPALQTIYMQIRGDYDFSTICLRAPQLWNASLHMHLGDHRIKFLPGLTHFTGSIPCPEDLHSLSQLPNLRRCRLWMNLATLEAPAVTVAHLTHLYVCHIDVLDVLSAPLLHSLAVNFQKMLSGPRSSSPQESLTRFLHRSNCHLKSLSLTETLTHTLDTPSRVFALKACSTISRLQLVLYSETGNGIIEALTSPSVLPTLHHLILSISLPSEDEWTTILSMLREIGEYDGYLAEDMRALTGGDFEIRVAKWDTPDIE